MTCHHRPSPPPHRPSARRHALGRHRRIRTALLVLALLALLVAPALGGCTRARTALAIQSDDTVSGEVVVAVAGGPPPVIALPAGLVGRVSVAPYDEDDYQGSRLQFGGLRFDELNSMVSAVPAGSGRFHYALRRAGNRILLNGQVDLSAVPVDRTDVQLKVAFPGDVVSSDGKLDDGTISWVFPPGQVSEFGAEISSPDPAAPSVGRWALLITAVVAAAATGAVLLAKAHRNPPLRRPGQGL